MSNLLEKAFKNKELGIKITLILTNNKLFGFEGKMLLRSLVIVKQEMHYQDMLIMRIKNNYLLIIPASTKRGRWHQIPASTKRGRWLQVVVCALI